MMERHSDVSRTACLRNRMLYLPIKTRSMRVCPRVFILVYVHFLQLQRPRSHIRAIRPITSRWSVGLRQISCSYKPQATTSPTVVSVVPIVFVVLKTSSSKAHRAIRVDLRYLCSFKKQQLSRVRLLIRVLCAIRVSIRIHAEFVPKTQQASLPNEAGFIGT